MAHLMTEKILVTGANRGEDIHHEREVTNRFLTGGEDFSLGVQQLIGEAEARWVDILHITDIGVVAIAPRLDIAGHIDIGEVDDQFFPLGEILGSR